MYVCMYVCMYQHVRYLACNYVKIYVVKVVSSLAECTNQDMPVLPEVMFLRIVATVCMYVCVEDLQCMYVHIACICKSACTNS